MLKPLTSLRFFFALMVFASHLDIFGIEDAVFTRLYNRIFSEGYLGVSFFFILSGFILSVNYKQKFEKGSIVSKAFWVGRLGRIYPLHLLTLFIAVPITIWELGSGSLLLLVNFVLHLFLLQSFIPDAAIYYSLNSPSWSISCEMFFYLLFPFLIKYLAGIKRLFIPVIVLFIAAMVVWPHSIKQGLFYVNPFFRLVDFVIGILLFELYKSKTIQTLFAKTSSATIAELACLMVFCIFFYFHPRVAYVFRFSAYYWLPMAGIILAFSFQSGYVSKLLSGRLLLFLGEISFGFYLLHQLFIRYLVWLNANYQLTANKYLLIMLSFTLAIIASVISFKYVEKPALKYIKDKYYSAQQKRLSALAPLTEA